MNMHAQALPDNDAAGESDWEQAATSLIYAALCLPLRDRLATATPTAWDTALDLLDSDDPVLHDRGLVWLIGVLATTPNPGSAVAQRLLEARTR